jgi:hypothetical protein
MLMRVKVVLTSLLALVVLTSATGRAAAPESTDEWVSIVRESLREQLNAIDSIECSLLSTRSPVDEAYLEQQIRIALSGEKVYIAWLTLLTDRRPQDAGEHAWDGQIAYWRSVDSVSWSPARENAISMFQGYTPWNIALGSVALALQLELPLAQPMIATDRIVSAQRLASGEIEIVFRSMQPGLEDHTVTTIHASDKGYWPVRSEYKSPHGNTSAEITLHAFERDGRTFWLPSKRVLHWQRLDQGEHIPSVETVEVDLATLRINQPVPDERFVLEPWPTQSIWDSRGARPGVDLCLLNRPIHPPAQPDAAIDIAEVGFPWETLPLERMRRPNAWREILERRASRPQAAPGDRLFLLVRPGSESEGLGRRDTSLAATQMTVA